ncbi:MAG TPA: nucleotidyltransferase domain-containing protein, partial [Nitrospirae bacterium]|nr:nucleotidyltransferase domain-containing protein [Nitrospirota bacterium]
MIAPELMEIVKSRLINTYNPEVIYLFGSYAWGKPDEDSDLDLLVVVEKSDERFYKRGVAGYKSLRGL